MNQQQRKGYLLATASGAAVALAGGGAQAADMAIKPPVPMPPPASWAGWYVGLNAGANWQNANNVPTCDSGLFGVTTQATGFIGGGQVGYNWQSGNFVYGWEADIDGLTGQGDTTDISGSSNKGVKNKINWLNTDRVRAGLALGDTQVYLTGGLAVGGVTNSWSVGGSCPQCLKSESKTRIGWTVGGGIEHMLTQNWVVGLEALFVDLGHSTASTTNNKTGRFKSSKFSNQAVIGRVRASYKW